MVPLIRFPLVSFVSLFCFVPLNSPDLPQGSVFCFVFVFIRFCYFPQSLSPFILSCFLSFLYSFIVALYSLSLRSQSFRILYLLLFSGSPGWPLLAAILSSLRSTFTLRTLFLSGSLQSHHPYFAFHNIADVVSVPSFSQHSPGCVRFGTGIWFTVILHRHPLTFLSTVVLPPEEQVFIRCLVDFV